MLHAEANSLLPWLINGSLEHAQSEAVQTHASSCVICRKELGQLRALQTSAEQFLASQTAPAIDMRRINQRIDKLATPSRLQNLWSVTRSNIVARPWRFAFVAQSAVVAIVATMVLLPGARAPEFRTLSKPTAENAQRLIRAVFSPTLTLAELTTLLGEQDLALYSGPSERGVYTLTTSRPLGVTERSAIAAALQVDDRVLFAQPVTAQ